MTNLTKKVNIKASHKWSVSNLFGSFAPTYTLPSPRAPNVASVDNCGSTSSVSFACA